MDFYSAIFSKYFFQNLNYGFELSILQLLMCKLKYLVEFKNHVYNNVSNSIEKINK